MSDGETMRDRLLQAFDLFEFGVEMMAANLRRQHPTASPEQIEELLAQWLSERPEDCEAKSSGGPVVVPTDEVG
jgi:Rv0078B-related antitoxin